DHSGKKNGAGANHNKEPQRSGDQARPASLTRMLTYSGLMALICGVVGAWGYAHFFLSAPEGKGASEKHAGSDTSSPSTESKSTESKSSASEGHKDSGGASSESSEELRGYSSSDDANTLRKHVEQLSARVDELSGRVDSLARPRDWVSPDIRQLQVKMGE